MGTPEAKPGAAAGGAAGTPPAAPPAEPPTVTPPAVPPAPPAPPPPASTPGDPPPVVPDGGSITREAMLERVDRARKTERADAKKEQDDFFMEHYGTTDRTAIAKMRSDSKKLQEAADKRKREEMTEIDRHKLDLTKERKLREAAEAEVVTLKRHQSFSKQDTRIKGIASKHVADNSADYASWKFAQHVSGLGEMEIKAFDEKATGKWFANFAKENPSHARAPGDPAKKPPTRKPTTTGPAPGGKPPPTPSGGGGSLAGKTPRPGQPNSMNRGELRQHLKSKGLNY